LRFQIRPRYIATWVHKEIQSLTVSIYSPFGATFFVAGLDIMNVVPGYELVWLQFVWRS
jgi:hypothetical protein